MVWFCDLLIAPAEPFRCFQSKPKIPSSCWFLVRVYQKKKKKKDPRMCLVFQNAEKKWRTQACAILCFCFFFSCSFNVWSQYASMSKTASAWSAVEYEMHKPCGFNCLLIFWQRPKAEIGGVLPPDDSLTWSHYFIVESHGLLKPQTKSNNLMNRIQNNWLKIPFHGYFVFG